MSEQLHDMNNGLCPNSIWQTLQYYDILSTTGFINLIAIYLLVVKIGWNSISCGIFLIYWTEQWQQQHQPTSTLDFYCSCSGLVSESIVHQQSWAIHYSVLLCPGTLKDSDVFPAFAKGMSWQRLLEFKPNL